MNTNDPVTVIKNDHLGREKLRYDGLVLECGPDYVLLEARFIMDVLVMDYAEFRRGDRFIERYYTDRWYNVYEIHGVDDDHLKGWYCNFTRPAVVTDGFVQYDDLALDLWVYPNGRKLVLDREEFDALTLTVEERQSVLAALAELQDRVWR